MNARMLVRIGKAIERAVGAQEPYDLREGDRFREVVGFVGRELVLEFEADAVAEERMERYMNEMEFS